MDFYRVNQYSGVRLVIRSRKQSNGATVYRIRLIHWNDDESAERAVKLSALGYMVDHQPLTPDSLRDLQRNPPDGVVIDLSRLPSQGRDVAMALRARKSSRHVPLVFVEGKPEKVSPVKQSLPDAIYTTWGRMRGSLRAALDNPPVEPTVPRSVMDGYAGTPLPEKLGIKADTTIALISAPDDFEQLLGPLPARVKLRRNARGRRDLTIWFTRTTGNLENGIDRMAEQIASGGLWIAWPKKASGIESDLTQTIVRKVGLAAGLVDFKICAIDDVWSGLKFTRRKQ